MRRAASTVGTVTIVFSSLCLLAWRSCLGLFELGPSALASSGGHLCLRHSAGTGCLPCADPRCRCVAISGAQRQSPSAAWALAAGGEFEGLGALRMVLLRGFAGRAVEPSNSRSTEHKHLRHTQSHTQARGRCGREPLCHCYIRCVVQHVGVCWSCQQWCCVSGTC